MVFSTPSSAEIRLYPSFTPPHILTGEADWWNVILRHTKYLGAFADVGEGRRMPRRSS